MVHAYASQEGWGLLSGMAHRITLRVSPAEIQILAKLMERVSPIFVGTPAEDSAFAEFKRKVDQAKKFLDEAGADMRGEG